MRNISDTAYWAASYRALENDRQDALFRDPFARRLAGERGHEIVETLPHAERDTWAWVTRTYLFDRFIIEQVKQGADLVVNLAAGLDARPYRMSLPSRLKWVEIDLPEILAYKEEALRDERPVCALERIALDLSERSARRKSFEQLGRSASKALIVSEGLAIYLTAEEAGALSEDLAAPQSFWRWTLDIASPGLLRMLQRDVGSHLTKANAPLKFAPGEGPEFFTRYGWRPVEVCSMLKTAASLKRVPFLMRLLAQLPESKGRQGSRPWSGVCLLAKQ